jgi:hypothetical protein
MKIFPFIDAKSPLVKIFSFIDAISPLMKFPRLVVQVVLVLGRKSTQKASLYSSTLPIYLTLLIIQRGFLLLVPRIDLLEPSSTYPQSKSH